MTSFFCYVSSCSLAREVKVYSLCPAVVVKELIPILLPSSSLSPSFSHEVS